LDIQFIAVSSQFQGQAERRQGVGRRGGAGASVTQIQWFAHSSVPREPVWPRDISSIFQVRAPTPMLAKVVQKPSGYAFREQNRQAQADSASYHGECL
jgi:hypothetical protein